MAVEEDMSLLLAFEGLSTAPGVLGRPCSPAPSSRHLCSSSFLLRPDTTSWGPRSPGAGKREVLRLGQASGPTACSQSSTYQLGQHFLQLLQVHTDQVLSLGLSHTADGRFLGWGSGR